MPLDTALNLKMSKDEKQALRVKAAEMGVSMSEYARRALKAIMDYQEMAERPSNALKEE